MSEPGGRGTLFGPGGQPVLHQSMAVSSSSDAENRHAPRDPRRTRHLVLPPPGFVAGKGTQARHSTAQPGAAPHSTAQQCSTKRGKAQTARRNTTQHNTAQHGTSRHIASHLGTFCTRMESHTTAPHSRHCERRTGRCAKALTWRYLQGLGKVGFWRGGCAYIRHLYRGFIWSQAA